jgi:hypothetical protein
MKLRDHPRMMQLHTSLWPPQWGSTLRSKSPPPEEGILKDDIETPEGHLSITMEFNGERFRGLLRLDDAAFRKEVYELLKGNIGMSIRYVGDLEIESK